MKLKLYGFLFLLFITRSVDGVKQRDMLSGEQQKTIAIHYQRQLKHNKKIINRSREGIRKDECEENIVRAIQQFDKQRFDNNFNKLMAALAIDNNKDTSSIARLQLVAKARHQHAQKYTAWQYRKNKLKQLCLFAPTALAGFYGAKHAFDFELSRGPAEGVITAVPAVVGILSTAFGIVNLTLLADAEGIVNHRKKAAKYFADRFKVND